MHTGLGLVLFFIFYVAGAGKDVEGRMNLHGEMPEGVAELVDVELKGAAQPAAHAYLVEVGEVLVNGPYIVFRGKCLVHALAQFPFVVVVVEHHGVGLFAVAPGAPGLLEVGFYGVGAVDVNDQPDVGFVDAHSEGVGGHHHACAAVVPLALPLVPDDVFQSGVVGKGADAGGHQVVGNFPGALAASHIDDGAAAYGVEDVRHLRELVGGVPHDVCQVVAPEAHAEHVLAVELQPLLNVGNNPRRGRGRKRQDGHTAGVFLVGGNDCPDAGYVEVGGPEVVAPLADAVGFIHGDKADVDVAQLPLEQFGVEPFG